jgi:hypothetical protein
MNFDDPIPFLPTTLVDQTVLLLSFAAYIAQGWNYFVQTPGGVIITESGGWYPGILSSDSRQRTIGNVGAYLLAYTTGLNSPHALPEYERRLGLAIDASVRAPTVIPPASPAEVGNVVHLAEMLQAQRAAEETIFRAASVQVANPVEIPVSARYQAVRTGAIWIVEFGGVTVTIGPTKRRARALAAAANAFLRHLQVQGAVDSNAISQATITYLGLAGIPGNGFVPVMNQQSP